MSSSVNVDNKKQDILTFGERTTQGLGTTRYRRTYPINFTQSGKRSVLYAAL